MQQNAFSAEFARAGGSFNVTTKSGANKLYGNICSSSCATTSSIRATFFSPTRAILKRNQFGGTLGGPVVIPHVYNGKNKTFFFVSYEGDAAPAGAGFQQHRTYRGATERRFQRRTRTAFTIP